ncbi:MAG: hypothetical protein CMJ89_03070 [Planctomycetes bacterium]|jgi:hypothetical protein|nr:hypothetical protein [Planctomycetota bacterium]
METIFPRTLNPQLTASVLVSRYALSVLKYPHLSLLLFVSIPFFLAGACATHSGVDADEVVPYEHQDAETRLRNARMEGYFPSHALTTQDGDIVRFYEDLVRDKQVLINFMYVDCDGL